MNDGEVGAELAAVTRDSQPGIWVPSGDEADQEVRTLTGRATAVARSDEVDDRRRAGMAVIGVTGGLDG